MSEDAKTISIIIVTISLAISAILFFCFRVDTLHRADRREAYAEWCKAHDGFMWTDKHCQLPYPEKSE